MTDTRQLLADYTQNGSETAFRELVTRYLDLVYSTAVRLVDGDAHRARDIAQVVFVDLAAKARNLSPEVMLGGWLHRHTCFVAANTLRSERRRLNRERQALEMNALDNTPAIDFSRLAPVLDEVINTLDDHDRTAILLRFYERHDFNTIGEVLGTSEDAARMRVNRALDKLQQSFKERGIHTTAAALSVTIFAGAIQAAPAGLASIIATTALAGTAVSSAAVIAATKTAAMTTLQKTIVTATVAVLAGTGLFEAHQATQLRGLVHTLQQQQAPLSEQIKQLQHERDTATNTVSRLAEGTNKARDNNSELLKLRGEVTLLRQQQRELEKLRAVVARNNLLPTEPEFHLPQINPDDFVETTYSTGPAGMETNSYGHPLRYTMSATDIQKVSIQGFLNECMEVSGWHYLIDRDVVAGTVSFGLTNAVNGQEFVLAFEQALSTGMPEWWSDGGKKLRKENLVLIHYPYEKTVVVLSPDKAAVWPAQK